MKLQHQKDLAIAIAAILAITAILEIAVILAIAAILAISGHIEKPQLSCATLLEGVVLNYIYSKLRTVRTYKMYILYTTKHVTIYMYIYCTHKLKYECLY
jgi:hypothetical protein